MEILKNTIYFTRFDYFKLIQAVFSAIDELKSI